LLVAIARVSSCCRSISSTRDLKDSVEKRILRVEANIAGVSSGLTSVLSGKRSVYSNFDFLTPIYSSISLLWLYL
jgi:hypothetical protein